MANTSIPRAEHPQPQFKRDAWLNLNGTWTYEFDFGRSGKERKLYESKGFKNEITVPFCPESKLSGVEYTDFIESMYYHRKLQIPAEWSNFNRFLLHFGAVDYIAEVYLNGQFVQRHVGGSSPFTVDISKFVAPGNDYDLTVAVTDELRTLTQGAGKQSTEFYSHGCVYTRVTGIWQTVYLEATNHIALEYCRIFPDFDNAQFAFIPKFYKDVQGAKFQVTVSCPQGCTVAETTVTAFSGMPVVLKLDNPHAWSPEDPFLYNVTFKVFDPQGQLTDTVNSYAGLRKVHIEGNRVFINNKPVYQRLVLDQGFYPTGIWTAPTAEDLENDIKLSMACGFNGARLHQKVFEPLFHYYADKLGYLTWAEYPSWGMACTRDRRSPLADYHHAVENHVREWQKCVERDINHPSIIAWTPQNETYPVDGELTRYRDYITQLYDLTKSLDPTRPVNDSSGWMHVKTDLYTTHNYRPDAQALIASFNAEGEGNVARNYPKEEVPYAGQPFLCDEWGGFKYIPVDRRDSTQAGWGYHGLVIETPEQLLAKISEQIDVFMNHPFCVGYCYTQLTDVEQEQNGVLCYDRTPKAPLAEFAKLFGRTRD